MLQNVAGKRINLPLTVLEPDRLERGPAQHPPPE